MTYEEALEKVSEKVPYGVISCSYEDETDYYFQFLPKDEYEPNNKNKVYSKIIEYGINKQTGKIRQTNVELYYMLFEPEKLDKILKSLREID